MPARRVTMLAALLAALLLGPVQPTPAKYAELKQWADGPVRYIAQKKELARFRALGDDRERALYVEQFWARRDPTPDSLSNEYRQLFWERVQQANESFVESSKPGWKTDRGKIWVLYGPPTEVQDEPDLQPKSRPTDGHGVLRWIYQGRPAGRMDLNPIVVVPFVKDMGGEYRLSYDPELASVFFDPLAIREDLDKKLDRYLSIVAAPSTSELSVMLDLGRMQEVPPQEQVLIERVETSESFEHHPLRVRVDRFIHADRGEPLAQITVDLEGTTDSSKPTIVARFAPLDATKPPRLLGEDLFRITESGGLRLAQAHIALAPGDYTLTVLVAAPAAAWTGMHRESVSVRTRPDLLNLSDVVLASELEPLEFAALATYDEPYIVGPFHVVPKLDDTYERGDTVQIFFEAYGGEFPLEVTYRLQGREDDGAWTDLGRPAVTEQSAISQAWGVPTHSRWPEGEYRVLIEVLDRAGRTAKAEAPFTLVAP